MTNKEDFDQESKTARRGEMQPMVFKEDGVVVTISSEELEQKNISRINSGGSRSMPFKLKLNSCDSDICFKYFWSILLSLYFLIVPFLMLYVGINYHYCEDLFSIWLILGGVLCYVDCFIFVIFMYARRGKEKCFSCYCCIWFLFTLVVTCWWLFGFARVLAPARNIGLSLRTGDFGIYDEPFMDDPICKFYLFTFPFWLTLTPWMLLGLLFISCLVCACIDSMC